MRDPMMRVLARLLVDAGYLDVRHRFLLNTWTDDRRLFMPHPRCCSSVRALSNRLNLISSTRWYSRSRRAPSIPRLALALP